MAVKQGDPGASLCKTLLDQKAAKIYGGPNCFLLQKISFVGCKAAELPTQTDNRTGLLLTAPGRWARRLWGESSLHFLGVLAREGGPRLCWGLLQPPLPAGNCPPRGRLLARSTAKIARCHVGPEGPD